MHLYRSALFVILVAYMTVFYCQAKGCEWKTSHSRGIRENHRNKCKLWQAEQAAAAAARRRDLESSTPLAHLRRAEIRTLANPIANKASIEIPTGTSGLASEEDATMAEEAIVVHSSDEPIAPQEPQHSRRLLPRPFNDVLPSVPPPITAENTQTISVPTNLPRIILIVRDSLSTAKNWFNLWREYPHRPAYDPDNIISSDNLRKVTSADLNHATSSATANPERPHPSHWPFSSPTAAHIMRWFLSGSDKKSAQEVNSLVKDHLLTEDFDIDELDHSFSVEREAQRLDEAHSGSPSDPLRDHFQHVSLIIDVPSGICDQPPLSLPIPGLRVRKLVDVIKEAFSHPLAHFFHYTPFRLWYQPPGATTAERVYTELYNSDAFIEEYDKIQRVPLPPDAQDCKLERVVAAMMVWSDSTLLANFGSAKLWPIYLMFGNLSKYTRLQPNSGACQHIGYIPSLSESVQDTLRSYFKNWNTQKKDLIPHINRDIMHAVWSYLFDDDFLHAVTYGIVIYCADGVYRRVYPRLFTYSADYPEKVLLATIRGGRSNCLCPRCHIPIERLSEMGYIRDFAFRIRNVRKYVAHHVNRAREAIYEFGRAVGGDVVKRLLPFSAVPTVNAFATKLKLEPSRMLVVDFMHEFELGVWKTIFIHLLRLLKSFSKDSKQEELAEELDSRFRRVPAFNTTIRRFSDSVSSLHKMAARDFEDILQVAIPVFDGLFPEPLNAMVLTLLYHTAQLHALLKLQMHTTSTLQNVHDTLKSFGSLSRKFRDESNKHNPVELPSEVRARQRRGNASGTPVNSTPRPKPLNLNTYKFHSLGDYPFFIKLFGTVESYSTQLGEVAHKLSKRIYQLTSKNKKTFVDQIGKIYQRRHHVQCTEMEQRHSHIPIQDEPDMELPLRPEDHHRISESLNHPIRLHQFMMQYSTDRAVLAFTTRLQAHLLRRIMGQSYDGSDSPGTFGLEQTNSVNFVRGAIYSSKLFKVNYTTYDLRRGTDVISPTGDLCNVMVTSSETGPNASPFWYAQVLGVFRANVYTIGGPAGNTSAKWMSFLWIRWYGSEPGYRSGPQVARLPKVGFVPESDEDAFGFLDPALVIRGVHLIPAFNEGRTNVLLNTTDLTAARHPGETDDWVNFYVNIFLDRDMFMRFHGGGIGHQHSSALPASDAGAVNPEPENEPEETGMLPYDDTRDDYEDEEMDEDLDAEELDDFVDNDDMGYASP